MIAIAPPELCSGLTSGSTVKLGDLITRADIRDLTLGTFQEGMHPIPQLSLMPKTIHSGKYFYQNCCWTAMGKCDRCKAPGCTDRDWRNRGYVP